MNAVAKPGPLSFLSRLFARDFERYEGVRPIHIWILRILYLLMFVGVGIDVWGTLLRHEGQWDHVRAVAFCVWAAYPTLGLLGLINPLRMLPLVLFMLFYKTLWLIFVAYPLWSTGQLAGSPAAEMAGVFAGILVLYPLMPWGYVLRTYFRFPEKASRAG